MPTFFYFALPVALSIFLHKKFKHKEGNKANKIILNAVFSIALLIVLIAWFEPHKENKNKTVNVEHSQNVQEHTNKANEKVHTPLKPMELEGWVALYDELEVFKTDTVFLEYGFAAAGQITQKQWLAKVRAHMMMPNVPMHYHAVPGNLRSLAFAYIHKDVEKISRLRSELDYVLR